MKPRAVPLAVLLALALVSTDGCAAAGPPLKFTAPGGDTATIPFKLRSNHIYVQGTINESDSLWFFVDTGAGSNVVNSSTTARLKLDTEGHGQAHGAGGAVEASRVTNAIIRLPGLEFGNLHVASIPLDNVATQTGQP